ITWKSKFRVIIDINCFLWQLKDQARQEMHINDGDITLGMYRRHNETSDEFGFQPLDDDHCKLKHYYIHDDNTVRVRVRPCKGNMLGFSRQPIASPRRMNETQGNVNNVVTSNLLRSIPSIDNLKRDNVDIDGSEKKEVAGASVAAPTTSSVDGDDGFVYLCDCNEDTPTGDQCIIANGNDFSPTSKYSSTTPSIL
ncbi:hypothetical protein RFI_12583, partial [Reticulomyxa filosa]